MRRQFRSKKKRSSATKLQRRRRSGRQRRSCVADEEASSSKKAQSPRKKPRWRMRRRRRARPKPTFSRATSTGLSTEAESFRRVGGRVGRGRSVFTRLRSWMAWRTLRRQMWRKSPRTSGPVVEGRERAGRRVARRAALRFDGSRCLTTRQCAFGAAGNPVQPRIDKLQA